MDILVGRAAQDAPTFSKKLALNWWPARRAKTRTWPPSIRTAIVFMLPLKCEWPQQDGVPLEPFTGDFSPPTGVTDELSLLAPISASQDIFPSRWFRWKPPPARGADPRIVPPRATTRLSVHVEHGLAIHEGFTYHAAILLTWWH